jgi:hypothetical protein
MQIAIRIGGELAAAARAAEMVGRAADLVMMRGRLRIDSHPTNGILHLGRRGGLGMIVMAMPGVVMMSVHGSDLSNQKSPVIRPVDPHMVSDTVSESSALAEVLHPSGIAIGLQGTRVGW